MAMLRCNRVPRIIRQKKKCLFVVRCKRAAKCRRLAALRFGGTGLSGGKRQYKGRRGKAVRVVELHCWVVGPRVSQHGRGGVAPNPGHIELRAHSKARTRQIPNEGKITCSVTPSSAMEVSDACWKFFKAASHSTKPLGALLTSP